MNNKIATTQQSMKFKIYQATTNHTYMCVCVNCSPLNETVFGCNRKFLLRKICARILAEFIIGASMSCIAYGKSSGKSSAYVLNNK